MGNEGITRRDFVRLGALGAIVALGSIAIALTAGSRQARQQAIDRSADRVGVALNLLRDQAASLSTFAVNTARQLDGTAVPPDPAAEQRYLDGVSASTAARDTVLYTTPAGVLAASGGHAALTFFDRSSPSLPPTRPVFNR